MALLSLHDYAGEFTDESSGLRVVCLGLDGNCASLFLPWLSANPQDLIITNDVPESGQAWVKANCDPKVYVDRFSTLLASLRKRSRSDSHAN